MRMTGAGPNDLDGPQHGAAAEALAPRTRGRPRSSRARTAILAAAAELLLGRGIDDVSMDAVAKRAGVSKATIYRWWPTKESLALDTLFHEWNPALPAPPETGALRSDLLAYLQPWARRARRRPFARVITALIAEVHRNPTFARRYVELFVEPRRAPTRRFFESAVERHDLPPVDVELALDLIFGAIYLRLLNRHAAITDRFIADAVDVVVRGVAPASRAGSAHERARSER